MHIAPLRFLSYRYKKELGSVAFKIPQNPFSAGALPRTALQGELTTLPRLLVGWRVDEDNPHHTPPHSAPTQLRRSPCAPKLKIHYY